MKALGTVCCCMIFSITVFSQGYLRTDGQRIVDEKGQNVLLRGIGLGGWMLQEGYMLRINNQGQQYRIRERIRELLSEQQTQEFYDVWLANHTRKIDIDSLKAWGFNSVRLPMHFNLYTLPIEKEPVEGQQTWLEKGFAMTDSLLAWCKANRMYLILDLHAAPGGQGNDLNISDRNPALPSLWESDANQQKMIALWKKLAERYVNEPWIGGYDIINEPNWGFQDSLDKNGIKEKGNVPLRKLMVDITQAIREVDQKHIIIIEGNGWGNNYNGIFPVWDNNMVLSFHKYWNFNDDNSIKHILEAREKNNVPVWLGETGENSNTWFADAIRLLESHNIGWAWWPLKKVGFNNPLEIPSNHNYNNLVDYWNGKRKNPPKESDVYSGLLELATYAKLESNIIHRDVIDAMMRQPHSRETKPYKSVVIRNGTVLHASDYDLGVNGEAYFDMDTANYRVSGKPSVGNRGHVYRNDGVDIYQDSSHYATYYVASTQDGEWLQYTVNVPQKSPFDLEFIVGADSIGGVLALDDGKRTLVADVSIPVTGGLKNWRPVLVKKVIFEPGTRRLRIRIIKGGFALKEIRFKKS